MLVVNVVLDLQSNDGDGCFMVKPEELLLRTGEEQGVIVSFTAQSNRKYKEWYVLLSLLQPCGKMHDCTQVEISNI